MLLCLRLLKPVHKFPDSLLLNGLLHVNWSHLALNAFFVGYGGLMIQSIIYFECF